MPHTMLGFQNKWMHQLGTPMALRLHTSIGLKKWHLSKNLHGTALTLQGHPQPRDTSSNFMEYLVGWSLPLYITDTEWSKTPFYLLVITHALQLWLLTMDWRARWTSAEMGTSQAPLGVSLSTNKRVQCICRARQDCLPALANNRIKDKWN